MRNMTFTTVQGAFQMYVTCNKFGYVFNGMHDGVRWRTHFIIESQKVVVD
jgi:hypothetical protein